MGLFTGEGAVSPSPADTGAPVIPRLSDIGAAVGAPGSIGVGEGDVTGAEGSAVGALAGAAVGAVVGVNGAGVTPGARGTGAGVSAMIHGAIAPSSPQMTPESLIWS